MKSAYPRPPILECTIQISFADKGSDENNVRFARTCEKFYQRFDREIPQQLSVKLSADRPADASFSVELQQPSYKLSTEDQTEVAVCGPETLVISQLAPYPGWDAFFARFQREWSVFEDVFKFRKISRVGMRYVNRLDLPPEGDVVRNEDYLLFFPSIPSQFGNTDQFFLNVTLRRPNIGGVVIINSGITPTPVENRLGVLFDQDLVAQSDIPRDTAALYTLLNNMRAEKNTIFETCVTDKARALFAND
jgi:uncharacterized protein (TIGR04255 family)